MLINIAYILGALAFLPIMLYQHLLRKKRRGGWKERFGHIPARQGRRPCIWVHGVSVGEVNAVSPLVEQLERQLRDYEVVVSSTTDTGLARARQLYAPRMVFRYPLDFSWVVSRVMRQIRPQIILLAELEVWPNLLAQASRAGIPVVVVNGRITDRRRVKLLNLPLIKLASRRMFRRLSAVAAQDQLYAQRFGALGIPQERIRTIGSLKWDSAAVADSVEGDQALARALLIEPSQPLWVAGQTGPGEEAIILRAYKKLLETHNQLQLAIIPRKPERFGTVAHLIEDCGFACLRRSAHLERPPQALKPRTVILGDTMGELRRFYALADVVFVGRSLITLGGSDVMEVAGLGKPMLFGPHMDNFADAAQKLVSAQGAVQVDSVESLRQKVDYLLSHRVEARRMGQQARQVVLLNQGAATRTVELVREVLQNRGNH